VGKRFEAVVDYTSERFEPSGLAELLEDRRLAVKVLISLAVVNVFNAVFIGFSVSTWFGETEAARLALIGVLFYGSALVVLITTGSVRTALHLIVWWSFVWNILAHIVLGGFFYSGGFLLYGIAVTAATAMWLEKRSTYLLMGMFTVTAVALTLFESSLRDSREAPELAFRLIILLALFISTMIYIAPGILLLLDQIRGEQAKTEALMRNILPGAIVKRLKTEPGTLADGFEACSVLFADLVGFTDHSGTVSPDQLVDELNMIFSRFDDIVAARGGEKIKTIGDGYMAVAGLPEATPYHAEIACWIALDMQDAMADLNSEIGSDFELRVGVSTGPAVAGVIGKTRFAYDLWGTTVNVASRLESTGAPGTIHVTEAIKEAVEGQFSFSGGASVTLKGVGPTPVYTLVDRLRE
jgi:guanylate cyclase